MLPREVNFGLSPWEERIAAAALLEGVNASVLGLAPESLARVLKYCEEARSALGAWTKSCAQELLEESDA